MKSESQIPSVSEGIRMYEDDSKDFTHTLWSDMELKVMEIRDVNKIQEGK
jgi:hypothetical protein